MILPITTLIRPSWADVIRNQFLLSVLWESIELCTSLMWRSAVWIKIINYVLLMHFYVHTVLTLHRVSWSTRWTLCTWLIIRAVKASSLVSIYLSCCHLNSGPLCIIVGKRIWAFLSLKYRVWSSYIFKSIGFPLVHLCLHLALVKPLIVKSTLWIVSVWIVALLISYSFT